MRETLDTIDPRRRESDAPFLAEWCLYRYSASRKHAGDGLGIVSAIGRFKDDSIARLDTDKRILEDKFLFFTLILLLDGDHTGIHWSCCRHQGGCRNRNCNSFFHDRLL